MPDQARHDMRAVGRLLASEYFDGPRINMPRLLPASVAPATLRIKLHWQAFQWQLPGKDRPGHRMLTITGT